MQLHYNIIWIDDEMNNFKDVGDVDRIRDYLLELGFTPNILTLEIGKDIEKHFAETNFDLIISDLSIEEGHHGDDIIKKIRSQDIFTEVLFYSSQSDLKTIAEKLLAVDRISFHSGRRDLVDKIESLIKLSVAKLLELNATRGLITAETSELDVIIETIVMNLIFDKLKLEKEQLDEIINSYVDDFLRKSPDNFLKKYSEIGFKDWFHRIDANRKWGIFRDLLRKNQTDEVSEFLDLNKTYGKEVIEVRNKFAHSRAIKKEGKLFLAGFGPDGTAFEFDATECISIRKKLIEHREKFNELLKYFAIQTD